MATDPPTPEWPQPQLSRPHWLRSHGTGWRSGPPRRVHDNPYFAVDQYEAVAPTGAPATYWVHHQKNLAVGVIPLHPDGTLSMVGQWRFPFGSYSWELPEGGVPAGEAALSGAQRELREETGLVAGRWQSLMTLHLSNSSSDERCEVFLATDFTEVPVDPDPTEMLACARVSFGEALQACVRGDIEDAITVASLLRLHHMAITGALVPDLARAVLQSAAQASGNL